MKKLIAISVVFALVVGAVFAVDLGGEVIGTVYLLKGNNEEKGDDDPKVFSGGTMNRIRLQGEGANDDGTFGGWIRAEAGGFWGNAWWKPIDQFKIWIGGNGGDGFFGKEGNTGWMFYQRATDVGVTVEGNNVWSWGLYDHVGLHVRDAFYAGGYDGHNALYMTVNPIEILKVNLEIPFFDFVFDPDNNNGDTKEIFKAIIAQIDLNFNFGNIALTYEGDPANGKGPSIQPWNGDNNGKIYAYFGGEFGKLALDVGLGFTLPDGDWMFPLGAGIGAKVDITDAFGLKARVVTSFAGDDKTFSLFGDVLPYFGISDNLKIFASLGLGMGKHKDADKANIGFHLNPYVWVGQEWGPSFWAGFKLLANKEGGADKAAIAWEIPIALGVSF